MCSVFFLQCTKYKVSYDLENDKMNGDGSFFGYGAPHGVLGFLIIPCFILALFFNEGYEPFEVCSVPMPNFGIASPFMFICLEQACGGLDLL